MKNAKLIELEKQIKIVENLIGEYTDHRVQYRRQFGVVTSSRLLLVDLQKILDFHVTVLNLLSDLKDVFDTEYQVLCDRVSQLFDDIL